MEYRGRNNGLLTFLEHWGLLLTVAIAIVASRALMFFTRLSGAPWIWYFVASCALVLVGGTLICYAKLPALLYAPPAFSAAVSEAHRCNSYGRRPRTA